MNDDHLYDLVIEWDRRRKLGQEVAPEVLCKEDPELLEAFKNRIESVRRTDWLFEPDDTAAEEGFLTLPSCQSLSIPVEAKDLPASKLNMDEFAVALAEANLLSPEEIGGLRTEASAETPQALASWLIAKGRLTLYQARVILEETSDPLVLDRYVILDRLDAGGMGQVYKALHRTMERVVALKMPPRIAFDSPEKVRRFEREVKAAAKLCHPNIVTAFDACKASGIHFLVMELVNGKDFSKVIRAEGPLPVAEAVTYVVQAARGLEHAHASGLIHRDIKPSNLLLDKDGTVKVLDLGLARFESPSCTEAASQDLTQAGVTMGTAAFMSPEQVLDTKHADHRSDIYSLGCTLHFLLTGTPPYQEDTSMKIMVAHREKPVPSLRAARREVPTSLDAVFQKMVAKRPEDRYQSMAAVIEALEACAIPAEIEISTGPQLMTTEPLAKPLLPETRTSPKQRRSEPEVELKSLRRRIGVTAAVALLLIGGISLSAIVFKVKTADGTVVLECNSADLDGAVVSVDGEQKITITTAPNAERVTIKVDKGRRLLEVAKGGFKTFTEAFEISSGEMKPIKVSLERLPESQVVETPKTSLEGNAVSPQRPADDLMFTPDGWLDAALHRQAAEWVIKKGGSITVRSYGDSNVDWSKWLKAPTDLPSSGFVIDSVEFRSDRAKITDADLAEFESLFQNIPVEQLFFYGVSITDAGMSHLAGLSIKRLLLEAMPISDACLQTIKDVRGLSGLLLNRTRMTANGVKEMAETHPQLGELSLGEIPIGDAGLRHLSPLRKLTSLSLVNTQSTDQGLELIREQHPDLRILQLCWMGITDEGVKSIASFEKLESVEVSTSLVTDKGAEILSGMNRLTSVNLGQTEVTDKALASLAKLSNLKFLTLGGCPKISDTGLGDVAKLQSLEFLQLDGTGVSDAGLKSLYPLTNLRELSLHRTKVTAEGVNALKTSLPECNVRWEPSAIPSEK